jgi:hypothetical protein
VDEGDVEADTVDDEPTVTQEAEPIEEPTVAAIIEPAILHDLPVGPPKKLINQFNFCDRAALTYNNPSRVRILFIHKLLLYITYYSKEGNK